MKKILTLSRKLAGVEIVVGKEQREEEPDIYRLKNVRKRVKEVANKLINGFMHLLYFQSDRQIPRQRDAGQRVITYQAYQSSFYLRLFT